MRFLFLLLPVLSLEETAVEKTEDDDKSSDCDDEGHQERLLAGEWLREYSQAERENAEVKQALSSEEDSHS